MRDPAIAIRFLVEVPPPKVNSCNCSICRRYGTLWAYYQRPQVQFADENGPTDIYSGGDKDLELHRCNGCGCVTQCMSVDRTYERKGVNARLMAAEVLAAIPVRHTNAASW